MQEPETQLPALVPGTTAETTPDTPPEGLSPRMHAFVIAYTSRGDGNAAEAARAAGYPTKHAAQTGHRLLRLPHVQQAIHKEVLAITALSAPQALKTMVALLGAKSDFVRQTAAADLLNRSRIGTPERGGRIGINAGGVVIDIKLD
jgi:hypothetical protein